MSGVKSLVDVAKAMQETEEKAEAPGTRTLADVAREQEQVKVSAGMTLMDVARQQQGRASGETVAAATVDKPALLSTLARQIDAEDSARVASAIVATASEVKSAQQEAQRAAVAQSIRQVAAQEERAAAVLQSAVMIASREADSNNADDGDGYSSFEEEEDAVSSKQLQQVRETIKREQPTADDEDERAGPERTTPSDSKESKEFLRAVFRADKSRIRELLDSGDVDANAADQVRKPPCPRAGWRQVRDRDAVRAPRSSTGGARCTGRRPRRTPTCCPRC